MTAATSLSTMMAKMKSSWQKRKQKQTRDLNTPATPQQPQHKLHKQHPQHENPLRQHATHQQPLVQTRPAHLDNQQGQYQTKSSQMSTTIPQLPSLHFGREGGSFTAQREFSWIYDSESRMQWEMAVQQERLMGAYVEEVKGERKDSGNDGEKTME